MSYPHQWPAVVECSYLISSMKLLLCSSTFCWSHLDNIVTVSLYVICDSFVLRLSNAVSQIIELHFCNEMSFLTVVCCVCSSRTLSQYLLEQSEPLEEREILSMFQQMVAAIKYVHQHNVLHRWDLSHFHKYTKSYTGEISVTSTNTQILTQVRSQSLPQIHVLRGWDLSHFH